MNDSQVPSSCGSLAASLLTAGCLLAACIPGLTGCNRQAVSPVAALEAREVIGLTEAELRAKYPEVAEIDGGFATLVSKNLHPYNPPPTNKLLRFGSEYLVAELKDGRVIALHRVSG